MENVKRPLPKNAFDSEYMTEFLREVRFLNEKGIKYSFVRRTEEYGISQYKYKKTPALFAALVEFYSIIEAEKAMRRGGFIKADKVQNIDLSPEQVDGIKKLLAKEDDTL